MSVIGWDIAEKWARADKIREEFYAEKAKVETLLEEALILCNNTIDVKAKASNKSVVRSSPRPRNKIES